MSLCDYGCRQEGKYQLKNGKWCCSKTYNSCIEVRRKNSKWHEENCGGENNPMFGRIGDKSPITGSKRPDVAARVGNKHPLFGKVGYWSGKVGPWAGKKNPGQSEYMLNGGATKASSGIINPSKPQKKLFDLIRLWFPQARMNYPFLNFSLDVAIPEFRIWFEYDGFYWHQDEERDRQRQEKIEKHDWRCIRYRDVTPTEEKFIQDVRMLL